MTDEELIAKLRADRIEALRARIERLELVAREARGAREGWRARAEAAEARIAAVRAGGVGEQAAYVRGMEAALDMIRSMRASEGVVIGRDLICTALEMAVTTNRAALSATTEEGK